MRSRLLFPLVTVAIFSALSACGSCSGGDSNNADKDKDKGARPFNVQWEGGHRLHWGGHHEGGAGEGGPRRHRRGGGDHNDEGGSPIE